MLTRKWMTFLTAFVAASAFAITTDAAPGAKAQGPKTTIAKGPKSSAPKSVAPTKTMKAPTKTMKTSAPTKVATAGAKSTKTKASTSPGLSKKTTTSTSTAAAASTTATTTTKKGSTTSTTTTTSAPGAWAPSNPVAQKLSTNAKLMNKVTNSLPPNTDLNTATAGFKNFGQFVAAVNVSNNLGIAFGDLKAAMTGTTLTGEPTAATLAGGPAPTKSLGQAIQQLKPGVNATAEAQTALTLADQEIAATSTSTTPTTPTTTSTPTTTITTTTPVTTTTSTSTRKPGKSGKSQ